MKWYGILAFFVLMAVLAGIVIIGMNPEKIGEVDFGEPSYISQIQQSESICGIGTIYDSDTNSCVLTEHPSFGESDSKCGSGTMYQWETHSCILNPPAEPSEYDIQLYNL